MKTEHKFAEALKTLMATKPLEEISVVALSKKCHVNRQTFYYHFHDIFDLLTLVFLNETIPDASKASNTKDMVKAIFAYYSKNAGFIDATVNSAGKDLFREFINNICYQTIFKIVGMFEKSKKITANERKNITRFFSLAYGNTIVYYLSTYKTKTLKGMLSCFNFIDDTCFENAIETILEAKQ